MRIGYFNTFTFFACAKKVTKKAQPILMRYISALDHSLAKIGGYKLNYIEHFASNNKQDGIKSFGCTPYAEWVLKVNTKEVCVEDLKGIMLISTLRLRLLSKQPKVPSRIPSLGADFGRGKSNRRLFPHQNRLELLAPPFLSREKVEKEICLGFFCDFFYQEESKKLFSFNRTGGIRDE